MSGEQLSEKDRLVTRPAGELPTPLDPASPQARGYPRDPKRGPPTGPGDPDATAPAPDSIERTA
jgi:hypothetical protein